MSSISSEARGEGRGAPAPADAEAPDDAISHAAHRSWVVVVALMAASAAVLTLALLTTADAAAVTDPAAQTADVAETTPALSVGANLMAMAWQLMPPAGRADACAQFSAVPEAAWAAYSGAGDAESLPTQPEFAGFLAARC